MAHIKPSALNPFILVLLWMFLVPSTAGGADFFQVPQSEIPAPDSLLKYGKEYLMVENFAEALPYFEKTLEVALEKEDAESYLEALLYIGSLRYKLADFSMARDMFLKALDHKIVSARDSSYIFGELGYIEHHQGNYEKAYDYHFKALEIREVLGDSLLIADHYYALSQLEQKQNNFQLALDHLQKAMKIYSNLKSERDVADCNSMIGQVYQQKGSGPFLPGGAPESTFTFPANQRPCA